MAWRVQVFASAACAILAVSSLPARAQSTIWDSTISNTHWYVPLPHLLAYAAPPATLANPIAIGDQTQWSFGTSTNGSFTGTSTAKLAIGPAVLTADTTIQGFVTTAGQITMVFTPLGGGTPTIGLGQMRSIGGVTAMEMQMITGDTLLVTHWASMLPYNPGSFTPPAASSFVLSNASPQWTWTAGTPWKIVSPTLFGTNAPGRFVITDYQSGYFWGRGVGPGGSGTFTLLGSITPEGKVLFNTVSRSTLTSLYGDATGGPASAQMLVSEYDMSGATTGGVAYISLIRPYTAILAAMNSQYAAGAAQALYDLASSRSGLTGPMAPVLDALTWLSDPALAKAVSQTLPVLAGAASQATYTTQRGLQQIVTSRLDDLRAAGPNENFAAERNIWLRPLGGIARQNGVDDVPGYRARGAGVVAGIDHEVAPRLTLGGLFAYAHQSITGTDDAIPNSLGINTYLAGLYGAYAAKPDVEINFQLDAGLNRNSESRSISFMGSTASADYTSYSTHVGLGVKKLIPATSALTFIPSLRMDFAQVQADAYTESGAGGLNLNVDSQSYRELTTTAGLTSVYRLANHVRLTANAGIGYNALDQQTRITASYAGGGGEFVTYGLNVSPWIYSAGVGLAGFKADRFDVSLRYDIHASPSGLLNQTGSLVFKMKI